MSRYTRRTKIEVAVLALLFTVASFYIHVGQAGESQHKNHDSVECSYCHVPVADIVGDEPLVIDLNRNCRTCHAPEKADQTSGLTFHSSSKPCSACHSFHAPDQIHAAERTFRYRFDRNSQQRTQCFSCHGDGENLALLSDGHKRAAAVYHSDYTKLTSASPSQSCMLCHSETSSLNAEFTEGLMIPKFTEHGDHPMGVKVVAGRGEPGNRMRFIIDSRLRLFDGKVECQTCHSLSATTKDRLVPFTSTTELCNGCHLLD